jgi:hypothetical protein
LRSSPRFLRFGVAALFTLLWGSGCGDSIGIVVSGDKNPGGEQFCPGETVSESFSAEAGSLLTGALISLPESLVVSGVSAKPSTGEPAHSVERRVASLGDPTGLYDGIRDYIGMADEMKKEVASVMEEVVPLFASATVGEEFLLENNQDAPSKPKRALIEEGIDYDWKVGLYYTADSAAPELIIRFSLGCDGAKGRLLWSKSEPNGLLEKIGYTAEVPVSIDVTFDGLSTAKTAEIKFIQDLSGFGAAIEADPDSYYPSFSHFDIPEKVFLNTVFDNEEFTVYGTSYHPGWVKDSSINGNDILWGDPLRTMYMFKSKASVADGGAKMSIALPKETAMDTLTVWTDDSLSAVYGQLVVDKLNTMVNGFADGSIAGNFLADALMIWITDDLFATHADTITETDMISFISRDTASADASLQFVLGSSQEEALSVLYMINPAFYDDTLGFLGTYDKTKSAYYAFNGTDLVESANTVLAGRIDTLNANLDLSGIPSYIPAEVVSASITVE